jgi:hypothetical protein
LLPRPSVPGRLSRRRSPMRQTPSRPSRRRRTALGAASTARRLMSQVAESWERG